VILLVRIAVRILEGNAVSIEVQIAANIAVESREDSSDNHNGDNFQDSKEDFQKESSVEGSEDSRNEAKSSFWQTDNFEENDINYHFSVITIYIFYFNLALNYCIVFK
jgi:hypothetical protein